MKIAAAQINPTIGDIQGNVDKILQYIGRARSSAPSSSSFRNSVSPVIPRATS